MQITEYRLALFASESIATVTTPDPGMVSVMDRWTDNWIYTVVHEYCVFRKFTRLAARNRRIAVAIDQLTTDTATHCTTVANYCFVHFSVRFGTAVGRGFLQTRTSLQTPQNPGDRILAAHPLHVGDPEISAPHRRRLAALGMQPGRHC